MNNPRILITGSRDVLNIMRIEYLLYSAFSIFEIHGTENIVRSAKNKKVEIVICCSNHRAVDDVFREAEEIRRQGLDIPIILIVRQRPEGLAIAAVKSGINDCFKIPFSKEALLKSINNHSNEYLSLNKKNIHALDVKTEIKKTPMVGNSSSVKELKKHVIKIAKTDRPVLITGKSGTGTEQVAESIHNYLP